jgi:hypothetical protein
MGLLDRPVRGQSTGGWVWDSVLHGDTWLLHMMVELHMQQLHIHFILLKLTHVRINLGVIDLRLPTNAYAGYRQSGLDYGALDSRNHS